MSEGSDQRQEEAPSQLRSLAENMAILGLGVGLAVLTGESGGTYNHLLAGMIVVCTGRALEYKSKVDNRLRRIRPAETNREFLQRFLTVFKGLGKEEQNAGAPAVTEVLTEPPLTASAD